MLLKHARELNGDDCFKVAGVSTNSTIVKSIRNDQIFWIDNWEVNPTLNIYRDVISDLRESLSNGLRIPLKSFEGHLSYYAKGCFYKKHLDQHKQQRHRQVTFVNYLNSCDGGELVVYNRENRNLVDSIISPEAGKLVMLISSLIFHEVKTSFSSRYALTGWYRDDEDLFGQDDLGSLENF